MAYVSLVAILLTVYGLFVLPTQWLKIERVCHSLGLGCKILQISDLHVERLRITPMKLQRVIAQECPDMIVLTGDFTERENTIRHVTKYLQVFRDSGLPVYAVLGNHDYTLLDIESFVRHISLYGIKVLRNESVRLQKFQLVGIDDDYTRHSDVNKAFSQVDNRSPVIVITHDPNVVLKIKRPFHYLMAGHFHGKQFQVPFLFKLKPMGPLPKQGVYKGLFRNKYGVFYISKGIGQTGINARFLVRSEVTVHKL